MREMEGEYAEVEDALTGRRLKTKEQLIEINIQESVKGSGVWCCETDTFYVCLVERRIGSKHP